MNFFSIQDFKTLPMNIETAIKKATIQFLKTFSTLDTCKELIESYARDELGFSMEKATAFARSVAKESTRETLAKYPDMDRFFLWYYINCMVTRNS